jgi:hypothetical protein
MAYLKNLVAITEAPNPDTDGYLKKMLLQPADGIASAFFQANSADIHYFAFLLSSMISYFKNSFYVKV